MQRLFCVTALSCCLLLVGCGKESGKGGPGAKPAKNDAKDGHVGDDVQNAKNTFTITVPSGMTVTQGANEKLAVAVDRGEQFDQTVEITVEAPDGVEVTPATITAGKDQSEVEVSVKVDAAATVGEHTITVKAVPEEGKDVSESFKITVDEKEED